MVLDPRVHPLRRMRVLALALLLAALGGLAWSATGVGGGWPWVQAFCEAAVVGALADWFAVVALFRHPLQVPMPHTAIVPKSKARIAEGLALFVKGHFMDATVLRMRLVALDPAAKLGDWLCDPVHARHLGRVLRPLVAEGIALLDEAAVRRVIQAAVTDHLRRWDAAATARDVLSILTRDGRHHELLDAALLRMAGFLQTPETQRQVSAVLLRHARREWPTVVGLVDAVRQVDGLADRLAHRLASTLLQEFHEILSQPSHPVRIGYENWLRDFVGRLQDDQALINHVAHLKAAVLAHPAVDGYVNALWDDILRVLQDDLALDDSAVVRHMESGMALIGQALASDPALRHAVNVHVLSLSDQMADTLRHTVATHITQTIQGWDGQRLAHELELSVGRDLQFIRINGTLVGGVAGLVLHAIFVLLMPFLN